MSLIFSETGSSKVSEWLPEDASIDGKYNYMTEPILDMIILRSSPWGCVMRCQLDHGIYPNCYLISGIYHKKVKGVKTYFRHSTYIREGDNEREFYYATTTEAVDQQEFKVQYDYFKNKMSKVKYKFEEHPSEIISGLQWAIFEGVVPYSTRLLSAEITGAFADKDIDLLHFLTGEKKLDEKTKWTLCKVVFTFEKTTKKPPEPQ